MILKVGHNLTIVCDYCEKNLTTEDMEVECFCGKSSYVCESCFLAGIFLCEKLQNVVCKTHSNSMSRLKTELGDKLKWKT